MAVQSTIQKLAEASEPDGIASSFYNFSTRAADRMSMNMCCCMCCCCQ